MRVLASCRLAAVCFIAFQKFMIPSLDDKSFTFPPDLERHIFEIAAYADKPSAITLLRVPWW